jgi:phosphatidylinositol glycan class T
LIVWFRETNSERVDELWRGFTNALSGITCASLQFMQSSVVSSPSAAYRPRGAVDSARQLTLRRGALPREMVCTENLTPWLKLLPCGADGLAHLLNPLKLFAGDYVSQVMHVRRVCADGAAVCDAPLLELAQTLGVVQSTVSPASRDWSLEQLFGRPARRCPVASHSNVYVLLRDGAHSDTLEPSPDAVLPIASFRFGEQAAGFNAVARYDAGSLTDVRQRIIGADAKREANDLRRVADVTLHRRATGDDWLQFEVSRGADDANADDAVQFVWFDAVPWQMRIFFHTLQCSLNGRPVPLERGALFSAVRVEPANDRETPTVIELQGALRRNQSLVCVAHFQRAFMHWTEFPPDAHRGYDMGAGIVELRRSAASAGQSLSWSPSLPSERAIEQRGDVRRVYTAGFQLILPTPDFSMPYNVICLTGTVWALYFGNLFNVLVRRFGALRQGNDFVSDRPVPRLLRWLRAKWEARRAAAAALTAPAAPATAQSK